MAQKNRPQSEAGYGYPQPTFNPVNPPIVAKRDPATSDIGYSVGQTWINTTSQAFWALGANSGGSASWVTLGNLTSNYTTLTSATFATSTAATAITLGSGNVFTGTGSNAAVGFTFTPKGTGGLTLTTGNVSVANGNVVLGTAGNGLQIKEGSNARMGQATLVAGTVTVSNTSVTANTRIFISRASAGGTPGALGTICVGTVTPSTSFVINSLDPTDGTTVVNTDVSEVNWILVEKL